jgi:hypothetical protein
VIRYRLEFVGPGDQPLADYVYRDAPIVASTVELYSAQRYVFESVDVNADPPVAVLRKVPSG